MAEHTDCQRVADRRVADTLYLLRKVQRSGGRASFDADLWKDEIESLVERGLVTVRVDHDIAEVTYAR